jgi:GMP synthase (glutamine-hydrolysing)
MVGLNKSRVLLNQVRKDFRYLLVEITASSIHIPISKMPADEIHSLFDTILILDFGSQYSHLITRRCRELNVYCEMLPCTQKISELSWKPAGIILSGSPYSVYDSDAPHVDPAVFELGVPVMGICYGLQEIARKHGGEVGAHSHREYGHANVTVVKTGNKSVDSLFDGIDIGEEGMQVGHYSYH